MRRRFLLAAVLSTALVSVLASPALAQLDLSGDAPPPPEYQVKEDGSLIIGGDVVVSCFQIGKEDPYLQADGPEARACEAAGFGTAAGPSSGGTPASGDTSSTSVTSADARALPETGSSALPALLLAAGTLLAAGSLLAWRVTR